MSFLFSKDVIRHLMNPKGSNVYNITRMANNIRPHRGRTYVSWVFYYKHTILSGLERMMIEKKQKGLS